MRYLWALLLSLSPLSAFQTDITPHVGAIEVYGNRKVPVAKIEKALGIKIGDSLTSREDSEDRINKVPSVLVSRVEAACCIGKDMILYVGVEERDSPHMEYHSIPSEPLTLAASLMANYRRFLDEVEDSLRYKNADEDLTNGYSLMADPDCRSIQKGFLSAVADDLPNISKVVREAADPEQRAAAVYLLQYAPRGPRTTTVMVDGVQWALQDVEDSVRESAMHSLRAILVGAKLHPEQQIHFEATWLVSLINSVVWSDRFNASQALVSLTDTSNPEALDMLRARAIPAIVEMARWRDLQHALPAFILAGRLAGLNETQIKQAWVNEDRESVIDSISGKHGRSKSKSATE